MDYVFCLFGLNEDGSLELITVHRNEHDAIECYNELWSKYFLGCKVFRKKVF